MAAIAALFAPYSLAAGNKPLIAGALLLCLASCTGPDPDTTTNLPVMANKMPVAGQMRNYLLHADSVGDLRIGSTTTRVYDLFITDRLRKETYEEEGMPYQALEVYHDTLNTPSLILALDCKQKPCTVRRITVKDSTYHTQAGIRIGSTFKELKKSTRLGYIGWGETAFVAVSAEQPVTFELDVKNIGNRSADPISATSIPDSTRIKGMFMYNPNRPQQPADSLEQRAENQE